MHLSISRNNCVIFHLGGNFLKEDLGRKILRVNRTVNSCEKAKKVIHKNITSHTQVPNTPKKCAKPFPLHSSIL